MGQLPTNPRRFPHCHLLFIQQPAAPRARESPRVSRSALRTDGQVRVASDPGSLLKAGGPDSQTLGLSKGAPKVGHDPNRSPEMLRPKKPSLGVFFMGFGWSAGFALNDPAGGTSVLCPSGSMVPFGFFWLHFGALHVATQSKLWMQAHRPYF